MSYGYFSLPRSLTHDPLWMDLPPSYKEVFLVLLDHVCFRPQKFDDHGHLIELQPGQICISQAELLKKCSKHISLNEIERSFKKFKKYGFVRQEVRYRKSIITISHKETYELILRGSEVKSEPNLRQTGGKLEVQTNNGNNEENADKQKTIERLTFEEKVETVKKEEIVQVSSVVSVSFSSHREKEEIEGLHAYVLSRNWSVSPETIKTWVGFHGVEYVMNQFGMLAFNKTAIKTTEERWLQTAMIEDYYGKEKLRQENYEAVLGLKIQLGWKELKINKTCCVDPDTQDDYQYSLPTEELLGILSRKFSQKQEVSSNGI